MRTVNHLADLAAANEAKLARMAQANRYPMHLRKAREGTVGVTISETEYVMTRVEMVALRELLDAGIAMAGANKELPASAG